MKLQSRFSFGLLHLSYQLCRHDYLSSDISVQNVSMYFQFVGNFFFFFFQLLSMSFVLLVFPHYARVRIENVAELESVNSSTFKTFTESQVNITLMCQKYDFHSK